MIEASQAAANQSLGQVQPIGGGRGRGQVQTKTPDGMKSPFKKDGMGGMQQAPGNQSQQSMAAQLMFVRGNAGKNAQSALAQYTGSEQLPSVMGNTKGYQSTQNAREISEERRRKKSNRSQN